MEATRILPLTASEESILRRHDPARAIGHGDGRGRRRGQAATEGGGRLVKASISEIAVLLADGRSLDTPSGQIANAVATYLAAKILEGRP